MSMTFSGQVALVTGAAAGIGRATALAFAAEGLKVVVADLDAAGGEGTVALIQQAGGEALRHQKAQQQDACDPFKPGSHTQESLAYAGIGKDQADNYKPARVDQTHPYDVEHLGRQGRAGADHGGVVAVATDRDGSEERIGATARRAVPLCAAAGSHRTAAGLPRAREGPGGHGAAQSSGAITFSGARS